MQPVHELSHCAGVGTGVGAGVGPLREHCGVPDGFHEHPPTRVQCVWSVQLGQSDETQLSSQPPPLLSALHFWPLGLFGNQ